MSEFEVVILGVGDTFSERYHPTSLLLIAEGFQLAIDCPDMYRRVLRDASLKAERTLELQTIDHVLITHVHGDHMNGLEGAGYFKYFAQNRKMNVVASQEVRDVIWSQRLAGSMGQLWNGSALVMKGFDDYFHHQLLRWDGPTQVGPFTIHARRTKHHVPTSALRVEACGRTFAYSADTAFDLSLIAWLSDADLIVHETNLGPSHTAHKDLRTLPAELRARMRLVHYPDGFVGGDIALATEGSVFRV